MASIRSRAFGGCWCVVLGVMVTLAAGGSQPVRAGGPDPLLDYDFEDGDLDDFINPNGLGAIELCGQSLPAGAVRVEAGQLVIENDDLLGLSLLALRPTRVEEVFPEGALDYRVRVLVSLESVNELVVYVRGRLGVDEDTPAVDSMFERGYSFAVISQFVDPELADGVLGLAEFTSCHEVVPHPEWPGGGVAEFARVAPGFAIAPGNFYWLEVSVQGGDDGGPVVLSGAIWPDGDDPPASPQLVAVDPDGLPHTPETLVPERRVEVLIGTSFDFGQQPLATARVDDLSITPFAGCAVPPVVVTRSLWSERLLVEGVPTAVYEDGGEYRVTLDLSELRAAGSCAAAGAVKIVETLPDGWEATDPSAGGVVVKDHVVEWMLDLSAPGAPAALEYGVLAIGGGAVSFQGTLSEPESDYVFPVAGESRAASRESVAEISDFGSIQHWLILGPFTREVGGANPGEAEIVRDYLTDGEVTEETVRPRAGDQIEPDFGGDAASTGLAADSFGRNPGGIATWVEWRDLDDADDRIDFESVYGDLSDVMVHALAYLVVEEETVVNFGVSSDDAVQLLLDGAQLYVNAVARGALARMYQDTPSTHPELGGVVLEKGTHVLLAKVFEGGGEHNLRVGFVDDLGLEIPGGPKGITISLEPGLPPETLFRRGDVDGNRTLELTDGIRVLGALFLGDPLPSCLDAGDSDDTGVLELTDAIRIFQFLFLGGATIPAPGPASCGPDPTDDALDCEAFPSCP